MAPSGASNNTSGTVSSQNDPFHGMPDQCSFDVGQSAGSIVLIARELEQNKIKKLGQGAYGTVDHYRVLTSRHQNFDLAIKKIKILAGGRDAQHANELTLRDRNVAQKSRNCEFTVGYYDTMVHNGEIWIVMELMDTSLDKFYPAAHALIPPVQQIQNSANTNCCYSSIPEDFIKLLTYCLVEALKYLHGIQVIHRDVKPSNILISRSKRLVKLCDFGISGELSNSIVTSRVGCQPYMAPERVQQKPTGMRSQLNRMSEHTKIAVNSNGELVETERVTAPGYGIKSDVWSLGITITETINGQYPYGKDVKRNAFNLISAIVKQAPPEIDNSQRYSELLRQFVNCCLQKDVLARPNYQQLSVMPFYPIRGAPLEGRNPTHHLMWNQPLIDKFFEDVFSNLPGHRSSHGEAMEE